MSEREKTLKLVQQAIAIGAEANNIEGYADFLLEAINNFNKFDQILGDFELHLSTAIIKLNELATSLDGSAHALHDLESSDPSGIDTAVSFIEALSALKSVLLPVHKALLEAEVLDSIRQLRQEVFPVLRDKIKQRSAMLIEYNNYVLTKKIPSEIAMETSTESSNTLLLRKKKDALDEITVFILGALKEIESSKTTMLKHSNIAVRRIFGTILKESGNLMNDSLLAVADSSEAVNAINLSLNVSLKEAEVSFRENLGLVHNEVVEEDRNTAITLHQRSDSSGENGVVDSVDIAVTLDGGVNDRHLELETSEIRKPSPL